LAKGGRLALHAETASRGCQPIASPTGIQDVRVEDCEVVQSLEASQGPEGLDAFKGGQAEGPEPIDSNPRVAARQADALEDVAGTTRGRAAGPSPPAGVL
jgi:hypothetical protein